MLAACSYRYTDGELKTLLDSLVVLIDSREQENRHITSSLEGLGIPYQTRKLDYGDYSCYLPANPALGIMRDTYFTNQFAIERKASLEELSGNLTQERQRFENELMRAHSAGCHLTLMVEQGSWEAIASGNYRTQFNPKAFLAALLTYRLRYNLHVCFVTPDMAGDLIARQCYYAVREYLQP